MRLPARVLLVLALSAPAAAAPVEVEGRIYEDTAELGGRTLKLVGAGLREVTIFKVNVYTGAVYAERPTCDLGRLVSDDQARLFRMDFMRDVSASRLHKNMRQMFDNSMPEDASDDLKARVDRFVDLFDAEAKKGMRAEVRYVPGEGTSVTIDGARRGDVFPGADFGRVVFGVWFGPKTCCPGLLEGIRKTCAR